jgi:hypothetical protein
VVEGVERYRIRVSGGKSVREWDVSAPGGTDAAAQRGLDILAGGFALLEVTQLGPDGQPGDWTGDFADDFRPMSDQHLQFRLNMPIFSLVLQGGEVPR